MQLPGAAMFPQTLLLLAFGFQTALKGWIPFAQGKEPKVLTNCFYRIGPGTRPSSS